MKTGLTGRTVLLPDDDAAAYERYVASFFACWKPVGQDETCLVQSLADTEWRLLRIPPLEMGIYAVGRLELAELFPEEDPLVRRALIEAKVFMTYQRQLNNLSIQESRLRRQREKDTAALRELQENRKRAEKTARPAPKLGSFLQPAAIGPEPIDL
ncbi:MAG: hypothetical protein ACRD6B_13205, partial [Bryobacteraceae bacterium]